MRRAIFPLVLFLGLTPILSAWLFGQADEQGWKSVPKEAWATQAREGGDAVRGASIFYQPSLACATCHLSRSGMASVGPGLGHGQAIANTDRLTDDQLVESILEPSKTIRKGYETTVVRTDEGEVLTGVVLEKGDDFWSLRNANGELVRAKVSEIESSSQSSQSLMPSGLVLQLSTRQQFLDLLKYLMEVRDGGPDRARSLQPDMSLMAVKIPEYESQIDHAGFISDWNGESYSRGAAIYQRVCANCHGTKDQVGSLPTALRFAEGKFKNGSDPYAMYRTLTHGYGFMPAQTWMVPSQKYDVIHYIREALMGTNPNVDPGLGKGADLTADYLQKLPKGDSRGPAPSQIEVWSAMDYGNQLTHCYEIPGDKLNIAYKGVAMRIDPGPGGITRGNDWMIFDTDTMRWAAGWRVDGDDPKQRFIDWRDIQFNGEHGIHPRIVGRTVFSNAAGPGWADPSTGSFEDDQRVVGRDNRRYGPLPKSWANYRGLFHHGSRTVVWYSIGDAEILESPTLFESGPDVPVAFARVLNIAPHSQTLEFRLADLGPQDIDATIVMPHDAYSGPTNQTISSVHYLNSIAVGLHGKIHGLELVNRDGRLVVKIPPSETPRQFLAWTSEPHAESVKEAGNSRLTEQLLAYPLDLQPFLKNAPSRWPQVLETESKVSFQSGAFAIESLVAPEPNPWLAQMRFTGLDFFSDGSLGVSTWDGDVWRVYEQIESGKLSWKRIATGLYQPLGLKILDDTVYLTCRDQLAVLRHFDDDGEADFIECLNNDHQVTEHFHEFAMGLQTDQAGNFYYAKSGRHALKAIVPQHGTLLRVTPDGSKTEILATGFRAANGVCLNPDGSFIVTDQEGFWNPKNRINWVTYDEATGPKFYGNLFGYHNVTDSSDSAMEPPLCWITNAFDRSPSELMWVDSPIWGELQHGLLNFSYGYGKIYTVLHEQIDGVRQGGMIELPIPNFPTGVMRGRFHPGDHHLYACGMFSWAGNATAPGGLYRIRKLSEPSHLPIGLSARTDGLHLRFAEPLAAGSVSPERVHIKAWDLKRSERYGSDHINERSLQVIKTELSEDGTSVRIEVDGLSPTWGMEILYDFRSRSDQVVAGKIHNTIHQLGDSAQKANGTTE